MTIAARTEFPAAARFSVRIKSDGEIAGLPDMQELSLLRAESAKQIETAVSACEAAERIIFSKSHAEQYTGKNGVLC